MYTLKYILLVAIIALVSVGCGTDGLDDVSDDGLSYANAGDIPDYVFPDQSPYSFTVDIENGSASELNFTSYTEGGGWLKGQLINNGTQVQLSGDLPVVDDQTEFGYSLTAVSTDKRNAVYTFSVTVND